MELKPEFWPMTLKVLGAFVAFSVVTYLQQGYFENKWWTTDYMYSLLIPLNLILILTWLFLVPKTLEISETTFRVQYHFGRPFDLSWTNLESWSYAQVLDIKFRDTRRFLVVLPAYPAKQQAYVLGLLATHFALQMREPESH
jgi:hypothetical protein